MPPTKQHLTARELFLNHLAQTTDSPLLLEIKQAEGIYLIDQQGRRYFDLISGIGVSNIGHRHPAVVKAIKKQLRKYLHLMVYGEYVQLPQVELARRLMLTLPASLNNFYFVNSGSEAIEGAMKLAKRYTGRTELISCLNAYHGSTQGALSISGSEKFKTAYRPLLPDVRHIRFNEPSDLELITQKTAAVVIETIQGEAGVRIPDKSYMQALRQRCTQTGALLILDEIQCGFGRTGKFWAFEHYDIVPDILVSAKGMGGGMPIGAFIAPKHIMEVLKSNPILGHITTFGGHPVSCAAACATVGVILRNKLPERALRKAELFKKLLIHPRIKSIRSAGLMIAVEFESAQVTKAVIDKAISYGVITDWFLYCDNAMRIAPPLTISKEEIRQVCGILLKAINKATNASSDALLREDV
ncbi:MAG: aspartate aminotransferase family protein [Cytophagales bacterium]|nr:aspartate aminotransferase family protein [Bernardetiaceae bacterium]MDW8210145.1 aspartate aminotransferase family protein [Cytophagales bacterium]